MVFQLKGTSDLSAFHSSLSLLVLFCFVFCGQRPPHPCTLIILHLLISANNSCPNYVCVPFCPWWEQSVFIRQMVFQCFGTCIHLSNSQSYFKWLKRKILELLWKHRLPEVGSENGLGNMGLKSIKYVVLKQQQQQEQPNTQTNQNNKTKWNKPN